MVITAYSVDLFFMSYMFFDIPVSGQKQEYHSQSF